MQDGKKDSLGPVNGAHFREIFDEELFIFANKHQVPLQVSADKRREQRHTDKRTRCSI